ncbi:DUF6169 family protein [Chitinophaga sp.]|uniref:DUF6169 family protein n=1 Tax=Chitinophaga sp. TaxID=1869181 RepID=UPI003452E9FA
MFSPYNLSELQAGIYEFTTDQQVVYHVYFGDGKSYFQDYPEFSDDVLTFGFDRIKTSNYKPHDIRIRITITDVFTSLIIGNQDRVLFFVCDSADQRGAARMRIFEYWYRSQKCNYLEKYNESIHTQDMDIHCSIILHSNNTLKDYIISSFRNLSKATAEKLKSY